MDSAMMPAESRQTAVAGYAATQQSIKDRKPETTGGAGSTGRANYGRTVGNPQLSEKAEKYYNELKKKYGSMEFILVSEDMKAQTQAQAGQYASPNRMVVLIDTDKIERMAEDENYRKQYEGIISNAALKMSMSKSAFGTASNRVKSYGMKVNDGGLTSFFAVVDTSLAAQKKRIEKNAAKKASDRKNAAKAMQEKRAEKKRAAKAGERRLEKTEEWEDTITVTASSWEELLRKVNDMIEEDRGSYLRTEEELMHGQHFDSRF